MSNITISDLHPAELEQNFQLTELSSEEIAAIVGGGFWGKLIGGVAGAVVGLLIGGPAGAVTGASIGMSLGDSFEDDIL